MFLNAIANNAPSLICLIDDEGRVTDQGANMAFERTLERDPSDIEGEIFWMRYVHPSDADEVRERIQRVVAGEQLGEHDNYWVTGTGRRLLMRGRAPASRSMNYGDCSSSPAWTSPSGAAARRGARGARLPPDRRLDDAEPARHRRLEALIVENGVNRAFTDTFGWSAWESGLPRARPPGGRVRRADGHRRRCERGPAHGPGGRWLRRDGDAAIVAWTATPNLDREGRTRVLLSGMDVTERQRREEDPGERGALPRGHRARARRDPRGRSRPAGEALEPGRGAHLRLGHRRDPRHPVPIVQRTGGRVPRHDRPDPRGPSRSRVSRPCGCAATVRA